MKPAWNHRWDELTPAMARQLQIEARRRLVLEDEPAVSVLPPRLVAVDVGYDKATDLCGAALLVWDTVERRVLESMTHVQPSTFPYIPGFLSFREIPALLPLFERMDERPSLVLCDGQGIAHPRRMGLAAHLGVVLDCPTLGWAKTRLIGRWQDLPEEAGSAAPLLDRGEQVGWAFRSRTACLPTFVSPGQHMSLAGSLAVARALLGPHRLCEPARQAHALTRQIVYRVE